MTQDQYRQVPEWGAVFKIQPGHGFEKVVYVGATIGITGGLHRHYDVLEAMLLCYCHPSLSIHPISAQQYADIREDVLLRLAA